MAFHNILLIVNQVSYLATKLTCNSGMNGLVNNLFIFEHQPSKCFNWKFEPGTKSLQITVGYPWYTIISS